MSAESELIRDKDGFLNCKDCPRSFLTELMFENHLSNQHKKNMETKLNQNQHSQTIKDQSYFPNNSQSKEALGNLSFGSQVDLKLQSLSVHASTSKPPRLGAHRLCSQEFKSTTMSRLKITKTLFIVSLCAQVNMTEFHHKMLNKKNKK